MTGCWAVVSRLRVVAFGDPSTTRPPQAALPAPDPRPTSYTWQTARGKGRAVAWGRVLAIHDTTPKATEFLHRWCGVWGQREEARLGRGGCGANKAFQSEAKQL